MSYRNTLTSQQRSLDIELKIDPGFVHHRKIQTVIGQNGMRIIDDLINQLPKDIPDWQKSVRIDHIYSDVFTLFCSKVFNSKTLEDALINLKGRTEYIFCSTVKTKKYPKFWDVKRAKIEIKTNLKYKEKIFIEFTTEQVRASTLQSRLYDGDYEISIIAQCSKFTEKEIVFEPIIMGFPWLLDRENLSDFETMSYHYSFYENYVEDFVEFSEVKKLTFDDDFSILKEISESSIKQAFAKILHENSYSDWGGETSDFVTTHLHLNNRRKSAAFIFKGPAKFVPMGLNSLGKNNDQIVRLAKEPCDILFVQHCHDILQPVKDTLRAFAVQPGRPRRYCLIDGRDTLRILKAYNLLDWAVENTKNKTKPSENK